MGLLLLAVMALAGCRQEVQFTKIPPLSHIDTTAKPKLTNVYVGVPVRLDRLKAAADETLPKTMKKIVTWLDDAACYQRRGYETCVGARADFFLQRDGRVRIKGNDNKLQIEIPLKFNLRARGLRRARRIRESKSGRLLAVADLTVTLGRRLEPQVSLSDTINWSVSEINILKGSFDVAGLASGRIKRLLQDAVDSFEEDLANTPIAGSAARVWKALHRPIQLSSQPEVWLSSEPVKVSDGGFTIERGELLYRIAIASRLNVVRGASPGPVFIKPMPRASASASEQAGGGSVVRVQIEIGYGATKAALRRAWPEPIKVLSGDGQEVMQVRVKDSEVYPSRHLVALGLDLDVETPKRAFDLTGKAYLTALPVIDPKTKFLEMQNIKLADPIRIPGVGAGTGQRFRLRAAPFVDGFSKVVRIDASRELDDVLAQARGWFNQTIGGDLRLHGDFKDLSIGWVQPRINGFRVDVELRGQLLITPVARQAQTKTNALLTKTE